MSYSYLTKRDLVGRLCEKLAEQGFKTTKAGIGSMPCFRGKRGSKRLYGVYLTSRESVGRAVDRLEREGAEFSRKPGNPPKNRGLKKPEQTERPAKKLEPSKEKRCPNCAYLAPWREDEQPLFCPNCQEPWI